MAHTWNEVMVSREGQAMPPSQRPSLILSPLLWMDVPECSRWRGNTIDAAFASVDDGAFPIQQASHVETLIAARIVLRQRSSS